MILSASRRTDIPCYYSDWFINRLKAGYALTRNPMNPSQLSRITLSPEVIDCIVFWTKDARNIMDKLKILDTLGYRYYFQFTLTPYDKTLEPGLRNKSDIEKTFIELSRTLGKHRVLWRYDPIVLNDSLTIDYHKKEFERLCYMLHPYTSSVTVSFVDLYSKLKTHLIRSITDTEIAALSRYISQTAKQYGLPVKACCEKQDLSIYGIERAHCIDKNIIESLCGCPINVKADKNQRNGCGCCESIDIGAYNTCKNGCVYCYANYSSASVNNNIKKHLPNGELLIGTVAEDERAALRNVQSLLLRDILQ